MQARGTWVGVIVVAALALLAPARFVAAADPPTASAEGDLMPFGPAGGTVEGLPVWVVEDPSLATVTDGNGHWRIDGVPVGAAVTFALAGDVRYPIQTATFTMPAEGLEQVTFQSPSQVIIGAFETVLGTKVDPDRCVIAATVTRRGYSLYGGAADGTHGEPGATVAISPEPAEGGDPIYFNGAQFDVIWPDRALTETTSDGGVLFVNVPPGTYVLTATKPGATIRPVTVGCRAGVLTNASPPWGLQVTAGGLELDEVVPFPTATSTSTTTTLATSPSTTSAAPTTTPGAPVPVPAPGPAAAVDGAPTYAG